MLFRMSSSFSPLANRNPTCLFSSVLYDRLLVSESATSTRRLHTYSETTGPDKCRKCHPLQLDQKKSLGRHRRAFPFYRTIPYTATRKRKYSKLRASQTNCWMPVSQ
jgi:hypothetical protein